MPETLLIDYSDLWHLDCLSTKVINGIFRDDIALGKWDGARQIRVVDNLLAHSMHVLLSTPGVTARLACLDMASTMLLPETFEVLCMPDALPELRRLHLGTIHSSITRPITHILSRHENLTHLSVTRPPSPDAEQLLAQKSLHSFALLEDLDETT